MAVTPKLAAFVGAVAVAAPTAASSRQPGTWTFGQLGKARGVTYTFHPLAFSPSPTIRLRLPPHAHEGGTTWYVLHLHYRAFVAAPSKTGRASIIAAAINDVGCAYIRFRPLSSKTTEIVEDGLIGGVTRRVVHDRVVTGWFENYLPVAGVHGGANRLDLIVAQQTGEVLSKVAFLPNSFIGRTTHAPGVLRLSTAVEPVTPVSGRTLRVKVTVTNIGGRMQHVVNVGITGRTNILRIPGSERRGLGAVGPGKRKTVVFHLRALKRGDAILTVVAAGESASTGRMLHIHVR